MRQVTHALLTRPPLSHIHFSSEENLQKCFVRLACVKHAASVHPEPGSNSHNKISIQFQNQLAFKPLSFSLLFLVAQSFDCCSWMTGISSGLNFSESFKVISLFSYQGSLLLPFFATAYLYYHSCASLSTTFLIYFFVCCRFPRQLVYNITIFFDCQQLFLFFFFFDIICPAAPS